MLDLLMWFMSLLDWNMPRPYAYQSWDVSWFHYSTLLMIVVFTIFLIPVFRKASEENIKKFVFRTGLFMVFFESIRSAFFTYMGGGQYPWYIFPFQFCATPIFIAVAVGFTKPGYLREVLYTYLTSFALLAGILVMALPNDIYIDKVIINLQTTFQHGAMVVMGLVLASKRVKFNVKNMIGASAIFAGFVIVAMAMNEIANALIPGQGFNMFFINPQVGTHLPVFKDIFPLVPYPIYLLIYAGSFSIFAALFLLMFTQLSTLLSRAIPDYAMPKWRFIKI